ncbi:hypothetical protein [Streptomyces sp. NPDC001137]|uniref:hypothetical protein n=1 Tax=Streptomyces sp. NPDC001137 TaxID=3154378 RepID=UPI0033209EAF
MLPIRVIVSTTEPPGRLQADMLRDAAWAHGSRCGHLEHLTVVARHTGLDLVLFLASETTDFEEVAAQLADSTCANFRWISCWRLATMLWPRPHPETGHESGQ